MILIVNVCAEKLHYFEFVKPIEDIVGEGFVTKHYRDLKAKDLADCDRVIVCGTSLKDNKFIEELEKFFWLRDFDKPVLGICAGMQILGLVDGASLDRKVEIGYFKESFKEEFLGLNGEIEVYHLHGNYVSDWGEDWECFGREIVQAVRRGNVYGVLFHPEVRNRDLIRRFVDESC